LAEVDVNVHPCKAEVRFAEPRLVHDALYLATARALRAAAIPVAQADGNADADSDTDERMVEQAGGGNEPRFWPSHRGRDESQPRSGWRAGAVTSADARIIGGRWIVLLERDRLILIDGRALIRDVVRDRLSCAGAAGARRRPLLLPVNLAAGDPLLEMVGELNAFGFELQTSAGQPGALVAVPVGLPEFDGATFVNVLREGGRSSDLIETVAQAVATAWIAPTHAAALQELFAEIAPRRTRADLCVALDAADVAKLFAGAGRNHAA
jgi:hypothetical protein